MPVFGTQLDDDIVGTAGRLADAAEDPGEQLPRLEVVYVMEMPLTVPLDAPPPPTEGRGGEAARSSARRRSRRSTRPSRSRPTIVKARSVGAGIVEEARRRGVEVIVMGGEPPTPDPGRRDLGGIGAARPDEVGEVTEYVLPKAPCRVLLTAPPEDGADGARREHPREHEHEGTLHERHHSYRG